METVIYSPCILQKERNYDIIFLLGSAECDTYYMYVSHEPI
nr:MAG TPA: hypothetical protein [Caudoviricetes sp.]